MNPEPTAPRSPVHPIVRRYAVDLRLPLRMDVNANDIEPRDRQQISLARMAASERYKSFGFHRCRVRFIRAG